MLSFEAWGRVMDAYSQYMAIDTLGDDAQELSQRDLGITRSARVSAMLDTVALLRNEVLMQLLLDNIDKPEWSDEYAQGVTDTLNTLTAGNPFHEED